MSFNKIISENKNMEFLKEEKNANPIQVSSSRYLINVHNNFMMNAFPPAVFKRVVHYRPRTKLRKGNVFTSVCQEICAREGVCQTPPGQIRQTPTPRADTLSTGRHPPPGQTPSPWADPSRADSPPPQQTATGIHSCFRYVSSKFAEKKLL